MYYFQYEKERLSRKRIREASKGVGKPRIGGDFELVDQDGKRFTSRDMKGKFALVSLDQCRTRNLIMELCHCPWPIHLTPTG